MKAATWGLRCVNTRFFYPASYASRVVVPIWRSHATSRTLTSSSRVFQVAHEDPVNTAEAPALSPFALTSQQILARAQPYGIYDEKRLSYESSLRHRSAIGSRLTDTAEYRRDLNLWEILLDFQILSHGVEGAKSTFRGMKYRGLPIKLYEDEPVANSIWQKLLSAAVQNNDPKLLYLLCERDGIAWQRQKLFAEVVGSLLKHGKDWLAAEMVHRLQVKHFHGKEDILELYSIHRPQDQDELRRFCVIYEKLPTSSIYAETIPKLWEEDRSQDAFLLHQFLISRGDLPPSFEHVEPFFVHLAETSQDPAPFLRRLAEAGTSFSNQGLRTYGKEQSKAVGMSPDSLNITASNTFGYKSKKLSDSFLARAFATKALAFDFVLSSLQMLGMIEVGPQSVREIGLSSPNLQTLRERFARLEELGVDTGTSAYVRFIKNLVAGNEESLLEQALRTDMHHDVFEDVALHARLIAQATERKDWPRLNLLLAMRNQGSTTGRSQRFSIDIQLRSSILVGNWRSVLVAMSKLSSMMITSSKWDMKPHVTRKTLELLIEKGLHPDERSLYSHSAVDRPKFVAGMLQDLMALGLHVPLLLWRKPLEALLREGDFLFVERLIIWLGQWYRAGGLHELVLTEPIYGTDLEINEIFDAFFQRKIVDDGLRHSFKSGRIHETLTSWKRPFDLLKHLQEEFGLQIAFVAIEGACRRRVRRELRLQGHVSKPPMTKEEIIDILKYPFIIFDKEVTADIGLKIIESRGFRTSKTDLNSKTVVTTEERDEGNALTSAEERKDASSEVEEDPEVVVYTDFFHPDANKSDKK